MPKLTARQVVDEWIKARCQLKGNCAFKALYASYRTFTEQLGYSALDRISWGRELCSKGVQPYRATDHVATRSGINLVA